MSNMVLMAQSCPAPGGSSGMGMLIPMVLVFGLFYFMLIRPQQRKERERQRMITELRVGQKVVFGGGLIGVISEVREATLMIEIASGTIIEVARGAISQLVKEGENIVVEECGTSCSRR